MRINNIKYMPTRANSNNINKNNNIANPYSINSQINTPKYQLRNCENISFGFLEAATATVLATVECILESIIPIILGTTAIGGVVFLYDYFTSKQYDSKVGKKDVEAEKEQLKQKKEEEIEKISKKYNISKEKAEKYHNDFISVAMIPLKNDGHEKGINAIIGYTIEKYRLAMDIVAPIIKAQKTRSEDDINLVPDGVVLYGPTGSGKTYIMEHLAEHLAEFGSSVKEIILPRTNTHAQNAQLIENAFNEAEQHFNETGKYTVIKFIRDIDRVFIDSSRSDEFDEEMSSFLLCADQCAKKGAVWIATANNPKKVDPAVLRRAQVRMPVGKMKDFQIGDILKYYMIALKRHNEAETFDYEKVVKHIREKQQDFTPSEYRMFVYTADKHGAITADSIIDEIEEYLYQGDEILTVDAVKKFTEDEKYVDEVYGKYYVDKEEENIDDIISGAKDDNN